MRRRSLAPVLVAATLALSSGPAAAATGHPTRHRDPCHYEDCSRDGDGNGGGGNGNSGGDYGHGQGGDQDGRDNCHSFCNWTIPGPLPAPGGQQPKGFIPPNPGKIPQQIADFVKVVSDFVQAVLRFAV